MAAVPVTIRSIEAADNASMALIIRQVGAEFGAVGDGFGPADEEVNALSRYYLPQHGALYLVAEHEQWGIIGGGGIAPFAGHQHICELRKLFLAPRARGLKLGYQLAAQCLAFARQYGYRQCYLDTLATMTAAIHLYKQLGFIQQSAPLSGTVHTGCDVWMLKTL